MKAFWAQSINLWINFIVLRYLDYIYGSTYLVLTGHSFWDRLRSCLHAFTWIVLSVHTLNKMGKFWWIYGQLLNIMSSYGWYEKSLQRSHNYELVLTRFLKGMSRLIKDVQKIFKVCKNCAILQDFFQIVTCEFSLTLAQFWLLLSRFYQR